jgi:3-phenylpropionate/trans-cinnamate dioxygenase ferredoxin reductase subunit
MSGEVDIPHPLIRPTSWYDERDIELRLLASVAEIWSRDRSLTLADGSRLRFAELALTTGARPRRLPGSMGGLCSGG